MSEKFRFLIVGLYTWIATVYFGGVLLDMAYANHLISVLSSEESSLVFSEISDTLLCIVIVTVVAAIGAISVSWKSKIARSLFFASLLVFSFEIIIPILFSFTTTAVDLSWIRLIPSGGASILAFIGIYQYFRKE